MIDPMLAIASTGASGRRPYDLHALVATGDWVLDTKVDGERVVVSDGRAYNRRGADVTHVWPEVALPSGTVDGEMVTLDGKFETTLKRSSQSAPHAITRLAEQHPAKFIAFDLPLLDRSPWTDRRASLEARDDVTLTPVTYDDSLWHRTGELGLEGVIAKRRLSRYHQGKRSLDWIKFKHLHRVTCVAIGYEPGNGSRAHFGAMTLALLGPGGVATRVGRVGSGMTARDIDGLKSLLDDGKMPVVEIECANVTSGGTLRFPVYKGQRLDVSMGHCTTDQLDSIPRTA